jgi:hypothetical protein
MKTGISCAHILTGKTSCHYRDPVVIAGNLLSKLADFIKAKRYPPQINAPLSNKY